MILNKKNISIILLIIIVLLLSIVRGPTQNLLVIAGLLLFNYIMYCVLNVKNINVFYFGCIIIVLLTIATMVQFNNAKSLGFDDGFIYGIIGQFNYSDTKNYYDEAQEIVRIWKSHYLLLWLAGDYPHFGFYGPYHAANILYAVMMVVFGDSVIFLILLKTVFNICSIYLLYQITLGLLKFETILPLILFNLFPAYIAVSSNLMRDNIIVFLVLAVFWSFMEIIKKPALSISLFFLINAILLFFFRSYALAALLFTLLIYIGVNTKNLKLRVCLFLGGGLSLYYVFASTGIVIDTSQFTATRWLEGRSEGINLLFYSFYYRFLGAVPAIGMKNLITVTELTEYFSQFYANFTLPFVLIGLLWLLRGYGDEVNRKLLLISGFLFSFTLIILITYVFGSVIYRLYCMWFWLDCILVVALFKNVQGLNKSILGLSVISCSMILICIKTLM